MLRFLLALLLLAGVGPVCLAQGTGPVLFSRLTVNQTQIAFSYAGDIWIVGRAGGEARRLTTHPSEENFPMFSPDGLQLAFSRQVGGNWDIYTMPLGGVSDWRFYRGGSRGQIWLANLTDGAIEKLAV